MEKFLKPDKKVPKSGGNTEKTNFLFKPTGKWRYIIGGGAILGLFGILFLFKGNGETTKVEIKSGLSPTQLETQLKQHLEPIYEGQKQTVETLTKVSENLKELSATLKQIAEEMKKPQSEQLKEVSTNKTKIQKENQQNLIEQIGEIPKQVIKIGGVSAIEGGKQKEKEIEPIGHISTVKIVQGRYGEEKIIYPEGYNPKKQGRGEGEGQQQTEQRKKPSVYIPAGSIVEAELLYGFIAPEKGQFPPVLLLLKRPVWTPNDWYIPLVRCAIITKAQYNISMGLAVLGGRGSTLSCVLPNGKVIEKSVNVAVGEEITKDKRKLAIIGLTGKEVWLTPKELAIIGGMAFSEGLSNAFQESLMEQSLTTSGNTLTAIKQRGLYALLGGIKESMNKYSEFWKKKLENKVPAIEVFPNKRVFVEFIQGVDLGISQEELNGE
jgi:hypothetical protein